MCPSADIPAPTDSSSPEYDAPPPGDRGFLPQTHSGLYPKRPASSRVDNPSEKPRTIVRG